MITFKKRKASAGNTRSSVTFDRINNQKISAFDFRRIRSSSQCFSCGGDYLKYSVNGYCQDCLQKIEFIKREHPHIYANASQKGGAIEK